MHQLLSWNSESSTEESSPMPRDGLEGMSDQKECPLDDRHWLNV